MMIVRALITRRALCGLTNEFQMNLRLISLIARIFHIGKFVKNHKNGFAYYSFKSSELMAIGIQ